MTIREAILFAARLSVMGPLFLLLTGQMAVAIAALRDGRSRRVKCALLAAALVSAFVFFSCVSVVSWRNNYPDWTREPPAWLAAVCACPAWAAWAYAAVAAAILLLAVRDTLRYRREHVTPDSVKQAMDLLPVGVAFGEQDGAVRFRNLVMDRLSAALTGKLFTDWRAFQRAAGGDRVDVEGRVFALASRETPGTSFTQLTATDVTELARILADLEAKNRKLKDIHLRLEIYNRQVARNIVAQEMLTARMTVHDELGHILLESRHYLSDPAAFNEALLLQTLKNTNTYLLREYEQDDTARDALADAIDTAEAIGVEVTLAGRMPRQEPARDLLARAIQECAANAVKHAGGSSLSVRIAREDGGTRFSLENDGAPPAGPVRESGGLLSLRTLTEGKGGRMEVQSAPAFQLRIFLPDPPING